MHPVHYQWYFTHDPRVKTTKKTMKQVSRGGKEDIVFILALLINVTVGIMTLAFAGSFNTLIPSPATGENVRASSYSYAWLAFTAMDFIAICYIIWGLRRLNAFTRKIPVTRADWRGIVRGIIVIGAILAFIGNVLNLVCLANFDALVASGQLQPSDQLRGPFGIAMGVIGIISAIFSFWGMVYTIDGEVNNWDQPRWGYHHVF